MSVAIVERHLFGGTCVNTGCTPTKAMVASAYAAHVARRAHDFGVAIEGDVRVDMKRVKAQEGRDRRTIARRHREVAARPAPLRRLYRHARFRTAREVVVGDKILTADRIFINVGGRAAVPSMPGLDRVPFLTNSSMMNLDTVPPHLVIVGGSYVGLEFGQMFRRFGSEVTIVEMGPRLVQREDADISSAIQEVLDRRRDQPSPECSLRSGQWTRRCRDCPCRMRRGQSVGLTGTHLLLAVGRQAEYG